MASRHHYLAPSPPLSGLLLMFVLLFVVCRSECCIKLVFALSLAADGGCLWLCGLGLGCARDVDYSVSPQLLRAGNSEGLTISTAHAQSIGV